MKLRKIERRVEKKGKRFLSLFTLVFTISVFLLSFVPFVSAVDDTTPSCDLGQVYLSGKGCITPSISAKYNVFPQGDNVIASSLGDIQPIKINNPYASAGQPVVVEFTLSNIGDQLGYPYDQIDLPADTYALQLAVDKDLGVVLADGTRVDVWGMMTGTQKVGFLLGISTGQFWEEVTKSLAGRTCGYVEMTKYLPQNVQDKIKDVNNGKVGKVYTWECIKIVDMPLFTDKVKSYCGTNINSACISKLNQNLGNSVNDVVTVLLSSGTKSNLAKGECERPNSGTFWKDLGGWLAGNINVVQCSIGEKGIKPSESVTFRFVALVPSDTPVTSPEALKNLDDIKKADGELFGGYTESASCIDSANPTGCHTIYGAVYPASQSNLISWLGNKVSQIISLFPCSGSFVWNLGKSDFGACMSTSSSGQNVVGQPMWEGQGTFYVVGPALSASITFILWGAFASGFASALRRGG